MVVGSEPGRMADWKTEIAEGLMIKCNQYTIGVKSYGLGITYCELAREMLI